MTVSEGISGTPYPVCVSGHVCVSVSVMCVSMSMKLSLNYMYVPEFLCNRGRTEKRTWASNAPKLFSVAIKHIPQKAHGSELGCETESLGCF